MESYQPSQNPNPEEWLALDEGERIYLVQEFHSTLAEELPENAASMHATIHVVVENQLALQVQPVPATIEKLVRQGLDRHEAIHAVGAILAEDIFEILKNSKKPSLNRYRRRLNKLTAKRWKKGKW